MEPNSHPLPSLLLLVLLSVSWVQASPLESLEHPKVSILSSRYNGTLGGSVLLPVSVEPIPRKGMIFWKYQGQPPVRIAEMNLEGNHSEVCGQTLLHNRSRLHSNFTLEIENLTEKDRGQYKVTVSFGAWEPEASAWLDVFEPIRGTTITIANVSCTNHTCIATLSCTTEGGTAVSYTWESGTGASERSLTADGSLLELTLNLSSIQPALVCTTRNPVSWQSASVDLAKVCIAEYPEAGQLASGQFVVPVVSCGATVFILAVAGLICWANRSRSGHWQNRKPASAPVWSSKESGRYHARTDPIHQAISQKRDSTPPPDSLPTPPSPKQGSASGDRVQ
ncbi:CD48 antigen-like [Heterodontus francisci]|uniref:CD48 antigen-like n=1 Tax=Heterodontus francisci TaxID=7792 RepID=UPI00355BF2F6